MNKPPPLKKKSPPVLKKKLAPPTSTRKPPTEKEIKRGELHPYWINRYKNIGQGLAWDESSKPKAV